MNREIKFRAFVYSTTSGAKPNQMRYEDNKTIFDWIADGVGAHVMQFTGLLDKNGKEIYEGDILIDVLTKMKYLVKFGHCKKYAFNGWYVENEAESYVTRINGDYDDDRFNNIEVIGNIYENPELLQ